MGKKKRSKSRISDLLSQESGARDGDTNSSNTDSSTQQHSIGSTLRDVAGETMQDRERQLLDLCASGSLAEIKELCNLFGVDVNVANEEGDTPLHIAVRAGNTELVQELASRGADADIRNDAGSTARELASEDVAEHLPPQRPSSERPQMRRVAESTDQLGSPRIQVDREARSEGVEEDGDVGSVSNVRRIDSDAALFSGADSAIASPRDPLAANTAESDVGPIDPGRRKELVLRYKSFRKASQDSLLAGVPGADSMKERPPSLNELGQSFLQTVKTYETEEAVDNRKIATDIIDAATRGDVSMVRELLDIYRGDEVSQLNGLKSMVKMTSLFGMVRDARKSEEGVNGGGDDTASVASTATGASSSSTKKEVEAFVTACKKGVLSEVKKMVEGGIDINAQDKLGWTGLHRAVYWVRKDVMRYLLDKGAKTNVKNRRGQTVLDIAPSEEVLKMLMGDNYVASDQRAKDNTSLHRTRSVRERKKNEHKLQQDDAWRKKKEKLSPEEQLVEAGKNGDLAEVKRLVEEENIPIDSTDKFGWTCMHRAVYWNRRSVIEYLVENKARYDIANRRGHTAIDIAPSEELLMIIMGDDYRPAAQRAEEKKHKVARERKNRLLMASEDGLSNSRSSKTNYSFKRKKGSKSEQLVEACKQGQLSIVKKLIEIDHVDVNAKDQFGWNGVQRAVFWDRRKVMKYLVSKGADIYEQNPKGKSALDMAPSEEVRMILEGDKYKNAAQRQAEAKKKIARERREKLLMASEDGLANSRAEKVDWKISRKNMSKEERLVEGCKKGDIREVRKMLEKYGVEVDARDRFGWTGLHRAVFWDRKKVVALLVKRGADPNLQNNKGQTALDLAPSEEMRRILLGEGYVSLRDRSDAKRRRSIVPTAIRQEGPARYESSTASRDLLKKKNLLAKYMDEDGKNEFEDDLGLEDFAGGGGGGGGGDSQKQTFMAMLMREIQKADTKTMTREDKYRWAAMYVQDALAGRPIKTENFGKRQLAVYRFLTTRNYHLFFLVVALAHMLIIPWEPVSYRDYRVADEVGGFSKWTSDWKAAYFTEIVILLIYVADIGLWIFESGFQSFVSDTQKRSKFVLVVAFVVDFLLSPLMGWIRVTRAFRVGMVMIHVRSVRSAFYTVMRTIPKMAEVIIVVSVFVVLYTVIGLQLFRRDPDGVREDLYNRGSVEDRVQSYQYSFQDFNTASVALYVLLTGSNYPNVMYPASNESSLIGPLYFVSFHILGLYVFLNLVIPLVYKGYKESRKTAILKDAARERKALASAFLVLDEINPNEKGSLDFDTCFHLFRIVRPDLDHERARILFSAIDTDGGGTLDIIEWFALVDAFSFEFHMPKDVDTPETLRKKVVYNRNRGFYLRALVARIRLLCMNMVSRRSFSLMILVIILLNTVVLSLYGLVPHSDEKYLNDADNIFVLIFTLEIVAKLIAYTPTGFWQEGWNRFDFFVTFSSIISFFLEQFTDVTGPVTIIFGVIKVMRLFRVFSISDKLREFISTFFDLIPTVSSMVIFLILGMYFFTVVAMELFHRRFNNFYDATRISFNSFGNSVLILFQMMFQSNWDLVLLAARDTVGDWTAWYMFIFQFFTVYLVLNIMVALILDNFEFQQYSRMQDDDEKEEESKDEKNDSKSVATEETDNWSDTSSTISSSTTNTLTSAGSIMLKRKPTSLDRTLLDEDSDMKRSQSFAEEASLVMGRSASFKAGGGMGMSLRDAAMLAVQQSDASSVFSPTGSEGSSAPLLGLGTPTLPRTSSAVSVNSTVSSSSAMMSDAPSPEPSERRDSAFGGNENILLKKKKRDMFHAELGDGDGEDLSAQYTLDEEEAEAGAQRQGGEQSRMARSVILL